MRYLDDGCKWCGSQEWKEDDVEHYEDCPAPLLLALSKWDPEIDFATQGFMLLLRQRVQKIIGE